VATVTEADFDRIPGIFMPGQRVEDRRKTGLPHRVTVDSLGYRGDDFPRRKSEGEYRIVLVGDSGTWGDFVDDDEALPAQLEEQLSGSCTNVRVVNAGLGGSSILSQAHMVRRSLSIDPDLVLLRFNENDIDDLLQEPIWERIASNRAAKSRFPFSIAYPLLRQTAIWNLGLTVRARVRNRQTARAEAEARRSGRVGVSPSRNSPSPSSETDRREVYGRELESIRSDLSAAGVKFVFIVSPSHQTVAGTRDTELLDWANETARALGIPTIELLEPLVGSGREIEELYLLPRDGHASPLGYRIAAEALATELVSTHLPPRNCRSATHP
jgi:lysophospholipase L1-like esterase